MKNAYMNWSGGKDSVMALWKVLNAKEYDIQFLLTNVNSAKDRISMHGVRRKLLEDQAFSLGIPLTTVELPEQPGMEEYELEMLKAVHEMKSRNIYCSIFGDIFLEDLRKYREDKLSAEGVSCVFPIWKRDTRQLLKEFLDGGFRAIIVCINGKYLDRSFCGRMIDESFLDELPPEVDICGENGEFHSFVYDGPIFKYPIPFKRGEIVYREYNAPKDSHNSGPLPDQDNREKEGFYFCDLLPG